MSERAQAIEAQLKALLDEALGLGNAGALRLPGDLPEWLTPLVSIVPAQLFCLHLARAKGLDTEAPRHIRKVTLTK